MSCKQCTTEYYLPLKGDGYSKTHCSESCYIEDLEMRWSELGEWVGCRELCHIDSMKNISDKMKELEGGKA